MGDQASPATAGSNTHPQPFVFGGSGPAGGQSLGTARLHGSPKKGHKAGIRRRTPAATPAASPQLLEPTQYHLVPLLVLRHVQDIPTLVAFSVVSQHFHHLLSHKSGSILQNQLPALLADLKAPKAPTTTTTHNKRASTTWQPLRLWSAATRLQCLKWLCSITTPQAINSPEVAQSLLQLFWTAGDIPADELVSTLSSAGLQLTPELLLHACQHQRLLWLASPFMLHILNLPGAQDPVGCLYRLFAAVSVGELRDPRSLGEVYASEASTVNTLDTRSAVYQALNVLGVAAWAQEYLPLPGLTITSDMLPMLLSMALCFQDHARGDAMARLLCNLDLEPPPAAQHSAAHGTGSNTSSIGSSRNSMSSGSHGSSIGGCGSSLSSRGASSDSGDCTAVESQSTMLVSLMQQCVADGRDTFLDALCQSPAAAQLDTAAVTDLLRQVLRSPALRLRMWPPAPEAPPHPLLVSLTALLAASTLGPTEVAALLREAIASGAMSAEVLLQLPGASDLQAGQVFELMSAAVHAYVDAPGTYYCTNPRLVLALELGRFAATLPPDPTALVHLLKASMDTPRPYSVLSGSSDLAAEPTDGFSRSVCGFSSMGLVGWLHGEHVLQLLRHCTEKKCVWAWNTLIASLPTRQLAASDRCELVVWYKAVVAAATAPTTPELPPVSGHVVWVGAPYAGSDTRRVAKFRHEEDPKCTFKLTEATFPTCPRLLLAHMQPHDWVEVIAAAVSSSLGAAPIALLKRAGVYTTTATAQAVVNAAVKRHQWEVVKELASALSRDYSSFKQTPNDTLKGLAEVLRHAAAAATAAAAAATAAATAAKSGAWQLLSSVEDPLVYEECEHDSAAWAAAPAAATAGNFGVWQPTTCADEPLDYDESELDSAAWMVARPAAATATAATSGVWQPPTIFEDEPLVYEECEDDSAAWLVAAPAAATATAAADTATGAELQQPAANAEEGLEAVFDEGEEPESNFFECEGDSTAAMEADAGAPTAPAATAAGGGVQQLEPVCCKCEDDSAAVMVPPVAAAAAVQGAQGGSTPIGNLPGPTPGGGSWLGRLCSRARALLFGPVPQAA